MAVRLLTALILCLLPMVLGLSNGLLSGGYSRTGQALAQNPQSRKTKSGAVGYLLVLDRDGTAGCVDREGRFNNLANCERFAASKLPDGEGVVLQPTSSPKNWCGIRRPSTFAPRESGFLSCSFKTIRQTQRPYLFPLAFDLRDGAEVSFATTAEEEDGVTKSAAGYYGTFYAQAAVPPPDSSRGVPLGAEGEREVRIIWISKLPKLIPQSGGK